MTWTTEAKHLRCRLKLPGIRRVGVFEVSRCVINHSLHRGKHSHGTPVCGLGMIRLDLTASFSSFPFFVTERQQSIIIYLHACWLRVDTNEMLDIDWTKKLCHSHLWYSFNCCSFSSHYCNSAYSSCSCLLRLLLRRAFAPTATTHANHTFDVSKWIYMHYSYIHIYNILYYYAILLLCPYLWIKHKSWQTKAFGTSYISRDFPIETAVHSAQACRGEPSRAQEWSCVICCDQRVILHVVTRHNRRGTKLKRAGAIGLSLIKLSFLDFAHRCQKDRNPMLKTLEIYENPPAPGEKLNGAIRLNGADQSDLSASHAIWASVQLTSSAFQIPGSLWSLPTFLSFPKDWKVKWMLDMKVRLEAFDLKLNCSTNIILKNIVIVGELPCLLDFQAAGKRGKRGLGKAFSWALMDFCMRITSPTLNQTWWNCMSVLTG